MKNYYFLITVLFVCLSATAQIINIPDANFKARLLMASNSNGIAIDSNNNSFKIDSNNNGEIEASEALLVYKLNLNSYNFPSSHITNMTGLAAFQNLRILKCSKNDLTQIDLLPLLFLEEFEASYNLLTSLNISNLVNLKTILAHTNQITTMTQNNNMLLEHIWLSTNLLTSFDLSVFPSMKWVSCDNNNLTSINLSGLYQLDEVECGNNFLTSLNLNGLSTLRILGFGGNQISNVDLSTLNTLNMLNCNDNPLAVINVSGLTNLSMLNANNTLVTSLECSQSGVSTLFASNCSNLQTINVRNGVYSFSDPDLLYLAFRIENNPQLVSICTDNGEQNNLALTNYNTSGSVAVYNGSNCDIPVQVNMGVSDFAALTIKIYPNPTSSILNIEVSNNQLIKIATINNLLGQTILTFENTSTIDISSLTKGTYFITVQTDTGKQTQKVIKL